MGNNKGKAVIFLIIPIIIAVGLAAYTFYLLQKEKATTTQLSQDKEDLQSQIKAKEAELEQANNKISVLQASLSDAQSKLSDVQLRVKSLASDLEKTSSSKQQAEAEVLKLQADLEEQLKLKTAIQKDLNDSVESLKAMEARLKEMDSKLNDMESKKKALEDKVKTLEAKVQNVELGTIVVSPEAGGGAAQAAPASLEGKIAVVNKEYNFVVINLGTKDGVAVGSVFSVIHNNKEIGDIRIEKVHESMSAAGFVTADTSDKIAEGDKVQLKK